MEIDRDKIRILICRVEDLKRGEASGVFVEITPNTFELDFCQDVFEITGEDSCIFCYYENMPNLGQDPQLGVVLRVAKLCFEYSWEDIEMYLRARGISELHNIRDVLNGWGAGKQVQ